MQTEFLGLRTVVYFVPDVEKAKHWYTEAFSTAPYYDTPYYVGYNIGGYELGLYTDETNEPNKTEHIQTYWGINDIEASYNRLVSLGAAAHHPPQNVGEEIMVATVKDPWNNIIGLIYNPTFKLP